MSKIFFTVAFALLLSNCHSQSNPKSTSTSKPLSVSDTELGLLKESVFDVYTPTKAQYLGGEHGAGKLLPRASVGVPPQIPHQVDKENTISLDDNGCMMCHNEGDDSPLPASHKIDYFGNAPSDDSDAPAPRRQRCMMCHVQASDAVPL